MTCFTIHFRRLRATAALLVSLRALSPAHATAPVCADDEKLFELKFETRGGGLHRLPPYRVFTESSGVVHVENPSIDAPDGADLFQLCLPANECHTAVVVPTRRMMDYADEMSARWGEEVLLESSTYYMERVDFGAGCAPSCDPVQEAEFEFFLASRRNQLPLTWQLTDVETQAALVQGGITANRTELVFEKACVPRSSCLEFYLEYPQDGECDNWEHSLRLGGSIYSDGYLNFGRDRLITTAPRTPRGGVSGGVSGRVDSSNYTVYLGQCNPEAVCKTATEDLFVMEVTSEPVLERPKEDPKITVYDSFPFWFTDIDNEEFGKYYVSSINYAGIEANRTYGSTLCVPKDNCMKFRFAVDNPVVGYQLFQNGQELTQRSVEDAQPNGMSVFTKKKVFVTDVGDCPSSAGQVSSTARGNAAMAGVAALLLLGAMW